MSDEIPGKIGEIDDNYILSISSSAEDMKNYRIVNKEQYEAELKEAYFSGWEDRNDCELREILYKRKSTKEDYFKWFMDEKKKKDE